MGILRLFSRHKPKIKVQSNKKDGYSGWIKCGGCSEVIHANELKDRLNCCPKCNFHYRISVQQRIALLSDKDTFVEMFDNLESTDPLNFVDSEAYKSRLKRARKKSSKSEGAVVGVCKIDRKEVALGILDFSFMAGSMGSVVGEKLTRLIEHAIEKRLPVVIVSASGGARMQESIFSLMQMAKVSNALAKLSEAQLPYISIPTNPTTGGVTASFASLGDVIMAEPKALIGFAGPRVVEQTIRAKLPEGAQRAEFLLERGMIDCIAPRTEMKAKLSFFIRMLTGNGRPSFKSASFLDNKTLLSQATQDRLEQLLEAATVTQS